MGLIDDIAQDQDDLLGLVGELVRHESPSNDKAAVDRLGRQLEERCRTLDGQVAVHPQRDFGDIVAASWPAVGTDGHPILVLTHIDTVWPLGTIDRMPFMVQDGRVRGPGVYDMKASIAMMLHALRYLREHDLPHPLITWLMTTDEEVGSPVSRPIIEAAAREHTYVLCLEPPVPPNGALKTSRKGLGRFTMEIRGRAAHAGTDPERGVSAVQELANQIQYLHSLTDTARGTTVNVGVVAGGTRPNVVAAEARAEIDLRVASPDEAERVVRSILHTRPRLHGAEVTVTGGINRPPMERTEAIAAAFARVKEIGQKLGLNLAEASSGGGSDGNFTAALGVATVDGLGCPGDGAHAEHEHIELRGLVERTALLTALLSQL